MGDNAEGQRGGQRTGQAYPAAWTARDGTVGRQQTANMMFVAGKHAWKCSKRVVWMPWCKGAAGNSKQQQNSGATVKCARAELVPHGDESHKVDVLCSAATTMQLNGNELQLGCIAEGAAC